MCGTRALVSRAKERERETRGPFPRSWVGAVAPLAPPLCRT